MGNTIFRILQSEQKKSKINTRLMELNNFIEKLSEALEMENATVLTGDTKFRELPEWDSLSYLSVIAMMDEEYDTQIESADFKKLETINDIINFIEKK